MNAVLGLSQPGVLNSLLPYLSVPDALQLAQVNKALNEAVRQASRYWYLQCCNVKNMRGQKVNNWTDYRRLFLTARWQKQRLQLWTPKDQKHWSQLHRRKALLDRMETALGEQYEIDCLREVIKQETERLLSGKNTDFFLQLARELTSTSCQCKNKQDDNCGKHDRIVIRKVLHQHMHAWLEDSLQLCSSKDHQKTLKVFEDRVRQIWKISSRVKSKRYGDQVQFMVDKGRLVYDCETEHIRIKKGTHQ